MTSNAFKTLPTPRYLKNAKKVMPTADKSPRLELAKMKEKVKVEARNSNKKNSGKTPHLNGSI
jgi:hypothetical protein